VRVRDCRRARDRAVGTTAEGVVAGRDSSGFIVLSIVQLLIMAALVAFVFVTLRPLENNALPLWGRCCASPAPRRWPRSAGA
jgi:hypothetical protein